MKKRMQFSVLLVVLMLVLAACSSNSSSGNQSASASKKSLVIGLSQATLDSPFYTSLVDGAKAEAKKEGAQLIVVDAQNNIEKQNADVQSLITKGIDVLLLNPVNPLGVKPALKAAQQANIPVITVDRNVKDKVVSYIGRDNKAMGKLAGEKAVELLGGKSKAKGTIIEIQGDAGGTVMQARHDGFHEAVDKEKGIKVIEGPYCDYIRSKAVSAMQDLLQAHPEVNLVYAHNDDMALGAAQVLEQAGKLNDVKIVGVDGLMESVKQIKDGKYQATVINDPISLGILAIQTAVKTGHGEKVKGYIDGGTGLIDQSNADKYIDDTNKFAVIK
jgi:ribose transport system substrate-binding protein